MSDGLASSECMAPACEKSNCLERDGEPKSVDAPPPEIVSGAGADADMLIGGMNFSKKSRKRVYDGRCSSA